jgi:hypothetical protein
MTESARSIPAARKVSITSLLRDAFAPFFRHPRGTLKASALPFAMTLFLGAVTTLVFFGMLGEFSYSVALLCYLGLAISWLFPLAVLGVSLFRLALIGPQAAGTEILARRAWICFGLLAVFICAALLVITLFFGCLAAAGIVYTDLTAVGTSVFLAAYFSLLALLLYCIGRLSLVFPASAIDERIGLVTSWKLTAGHGLRLLVVLTCLFIFLVLIATAGNMALRAASGFVDWLYINVVPVEYHFWPDSFVQTLPAIVLGSLLSCVATALLVGTFAAAYARISGWGLPRQDILERFE